MFVTTYDAKFQSIPFYKTHPYMMPFVGCNYESPEHKKLLLVGLLMMNVNVVIQDILQKVVMVNLRLQLKRL